MITRRTFMAQTAGLALVAAGARRLSSCARSFPGPESAVLGAQAHPHRSLLGHYGLDS